MVSLQLNDGAHAAVTELDRLVHRVLRHRATGKKIVVDDAVVAARRFQTKADGYITR